MDHIFHARAPRAAKQVNAACAHWVAVKEIAFLETHNAPTEDWAKHQGRAQGYKTARQVTKATPVRTCLKDPEAGWWKHISTPIIRYTALVINDKGIRVQGKLRKSIQAKLSQLDSDDFHWGHFGSM
eukprot:2676102-Pyramimonas_sp.AAC.1